MEPSMAELMQERAKLESELGKQDMQIAVLRWAKEHADALNSVGLTDSLLEAMQAERSK